LVLNVRLLQLVDNQPEYSETVAFYFAKYEKLPRKAAQTLVVIIKASELYHSAHGDLLRAVMENMQSPEKEMVAHFCYDRLFKTTRGHHLPAQSTYKEALIAWVVRWKQVSFTELETLTNSETDWWVRKSIPRELDVDFFGAASFASYVNSCMRHSEPELSRIAAAVMVEKSVALKRPYSDVNPAAKVSLKAAGLIKSVSRPPSALNGVLSYVLKRPDGAYDWKRLFGTKHKHAERIAVLVKQKFEVDIDACIVRLDSLCDLILEQLVARLSPGTGYGYGSILNSPNKTLLAKIPAVIAGFKALHDMRLSSVTAHPRSLKTGVATRRLKHHDYRNNIRPVRAKSFDEIESGVVP
jgi:hypothetical protein